MFNRKFKQATKLQINMKGGISIILPQDLLQSSKESLQKITYGYDIKNIL